MDLDVANLNKNGKTIRRTIYEAINERYFAKVKQFPRVFINICKKHPNEPQTFHLISRRIFRNLHCKKLYMRRW